MAVDLNSYKDLYFKTSLEYLYQLKNNLKQYQSGNGVMNSVEFELYRLAHTLKGQSNFMGYTNFGDLCSLLTKIFLEIKDKKISLTPEMFIVVNASIDTLINANSKLSQNINIDLSSNITSLQKAYNKIHENTSS